MARSKRKRCKVYVTVIKNNTRRGGLDYEVRERCEGKIKPGTPFCKEHFATHRLVGVKCTGEAHSNPFIDNCWTCMPFWGSYPVAVPKDQPLTEGQFEWTKGWE